MRPPDVNVRRVLLVAEPRDTVAPRDPAAPKVRRYRLARVPLNGRTPAARDVRHARLKRLHD